MLLLSIGLSVLVLWALGCGSGGGGGNSGGGNAGGGNPNPGGPSGGVGGSGAVGARSAFVSVKTMGCRGLRPASVLRDNNDSRAHQIMSTPHLIHTDCPGLNAIGTLGPGQSGMSDPLTTARGCGFHDHLNPDDDKFRGQVLVGLASGDPPPPDPGYLR